MESETLKLVQQIVASELASVKWTVLLTNVVAAGIGAFFGSLLKKFGELSAINAKFQQILDQQIILTKETEKIKGDIAKQTETIKEKLAEDLAVFTSSLQDKLAQNQFIRGLYVDGIKEFSSKQSEALRESYLMLFEPQSSLVDTKGNTDGHKIELARQVVMKPLRQNLGILDEETIWRIDSIQNDLASFKGRSLEEIPTEEIRCFYSKTEQARQFIKADKIAYRRGLISLPLEEGKQ